MKLSFFDHKEKVNDFRSGVHLYLSDALTIDALRARQKGLTPFMIRRHWGIVGLLCSAAVTLLAGRGRDNSKNAIKRALRALLNQPEPVRESPIDFKKLAAGDFGDE